MNRISQASLDRIDKILDILKDLDGDGMSVHSLGKKLLTDASNVKRSIDLYFRRSGEDSILEQYPVGLYSYYRIKGMSKKSTKIDDLFRGWGGAPRLGLG